VALGGVLGLLLVPGAAAAAVSVALVGFGFAAVFPTTLAQAGGAFAAYSGTAFTVLFASALSGDMLSPRLVGRIAQSRGLGAALWLAALNCAGVALLEIFVRLERRRAAGSPKPT
jgi:hypothetical protein